MQKQLYSLRYILINGSCVHQHSKTLAMFTDKGFHGRLLAINNKIANAINPTQVLNDSLGSFHSSEVRSLHSSRISFQSFTAASKFLCFLVFQKKPEFCTFQAFFITLIKRLINYCFTQ
ncbi:hypothetical protein [Alkalihalobacterium bogoriense]|uniref:hypothetical protein n=1 Tax=Alkalihalobacterium bogoriense TaxID=246272 RepID=UPI0012EC2C0C|nr:hypothetical protein [Alkalihalobacterium bogoriense]